MKQSRGKISLTHKVVVRWPSPLYRNLRKKLFKARIKSEHSTSSTMDTFLHYGYFLFLMRWNERGPCSTSSYMDTFLHYGYFLFLMRWNERGPCSTFHLIHYARGSKVPPLLLYPLALWMLFSFLHYYGCFCSLWISSVPCVVADSKYIIHNLVHCSYSITIPQTLNPP